MPFRTERCRQQGSFNIGNASRMRRYLNKWLLYEHLIRTQFHKLVLEQTSILSLKSQANITVIYEMRNVIKEASENLKEIEDEEPILRFPSIQVSKDNEGKIIITLTPNNLPPMKNRSQKTRCLKASWRSRSSL